MSRGVEPLTGLGQVRRGPCSLCGVVGDRTWTHVPPRCAGNDGDTSMLCKTTDDASVIQFRQGRPKQGGCRLYSQCSSCNGLVSRYDGEWPVWVTEMMTWLDSGDRRVPDAGFPFILPGRRPGAFVRSVMAGMFALTPTLRPGWPGVAEAIRTGEALEDADDLRLLMHLYSGPRHFSASGMGKAAISLTHPTSQPLNVIFGEIAWPPLHFVLVHADDVGRWPLAMDVTSWLAEDWQVIRNVNLLLKLVTDDQLFSLELGQRAVPQHQ